MRLLAYSHDTLGLGHLTRTLKVCDTLRSRWPDLQVLVLTGSPFLRTVAVPEWVECVKLPSLRKIDNETYVGRALTLGFDELSRLRAEILVAAARAFAPDVVLVDKTPAGLKGELLPTLYALREVGKRPRVVLGLRDVLDEPHRVRQEWERTSAFDLIEECYDAVWIYGQEDVFDAVAEYAFPPGVAARSTYVGYLPVRTEGEGPDALGRTVDVGGRRLIVVTAGGGEDGFPLFDRYLRAFSNGHAPPPDALHCLVPGPGFPAERLPDIDRRAAASRADMVVLPHSTRMAALFASADLVVTMGGYNSLTEVVSLGRRPLVVPRVWPRTEQLIRAERFAARGLARVLPPEALDEPTFVEVVRDELEHPAPVATAPLLFDGPDGVRREFARLLERSTPRGAPERIAADARGLADARQAS